MNADYQRAMNILPAAIMAIFQGNIRLGEFYADLFSGRWTTVTYCVVLASYILCQVIRSVVWAIRTVKNQ
jgi:hypothetical protein